jgi:hypothetical protein
VTSLTLAPKTFFRMRAKLSGSDPEPSPASANGLVSASCQVWIGVACQLAQRLELLAMLPSQVKLRPSNGASPRSGSSGALRPIVAMTLPSFGATPWRYIAALMLPAPGMFCATTAGRPGMCLPMKRASRRA